MSDICIRQSIVSFLGKESTLHPWVAPRVVDEHCRFIVKSYKQTLVIIPCSTSRPVTGVSGVYDGVFCEQGRNFFDELVRNA